MIIAANYFPLDEFDYIDSIQSHMNQTSFKFLDMVLSALVDKAHITNLVIPDRSFNTISNIEEYLKQRRIEAIPRGFHNKTTNKFNVNIIFLSHNNKEYNVKTCQTTENQNSSHSCKIK